MSWIPKQYPIFRKRFAQSILHKNSSKWSASIRLTGWYSINPLSALPSPSRKNSVSKIDSGPCLVSNKSDLPPCPTVDLLKGDLYPREILFITCRRCWWLQCYRCTELLRPKPLLEEAVWFLASWHNPYVPSSPVTFAVADQLEALKSHRVDGHHIKRMESWK